MKPKTCLTHCYISIKIIHSQLYLLFPFCYHLWVTGPYQGIASWFPFSESNLTHTTWFLGHETLCFTYTGIHPPYQMEPLLLVADAACPAVGSALLGIWKSQQGAAGPTQSNSVVHTQRTSYSHIYILQDVRDYLFKQTIRERYRFWTIWCQ